MNTVTKKVAKKTPVKKTAKVVKKPVTKAVKKVAPKKAVKKTTLKPTDTTRELLVCADEKSFWVSNGEILNTLVALRDVLQNIEDDVFSYHVNGVQNDFADWVEAVLEDTACAKDLRKTKKSEKAHDVVVRHLKYYQL